MAGPTVVAPLTQELTNIPKIQCTYKDACTHTRTQHALARKHAQAHACTDVYAHSILTDVRRGEWQDINLPQYRIIQMLARGGSYGDADRVVGGGNGSVFVVSADKRLLLDVDEWVHMYERTRMSNACLGG